MPARGLAATGCCGIAANWPNSSMRASMLSCRSIEGDKGSRAAFADTGLDCLVAALQEMKAEGKPTPLVGMLMDADSLKTIYGKSPDLKDEEVKRTFYGTIKNFFDRVPVEFRVVAPTGKPNPGRQANVVFVRGASPG